MSISVDGFVGGPKGEIDWMFPSRSPKGLEWVYKTIRGAGAHLIGSRTFAGWARYWPCSTDRLAAPMNEISKIVFSSRGRAGLTAALESAARAHADSPVPVPESVSRSWLEPLVLSGDLGEEVLRLKQEDGPYLLAQGGAGFARALLARELVDELRLVVHPAVLGRGLPLFADVPQPTQLALVSSEVFDSGAVALVYRRSSTVGAS